MRFKKNPDRNLKIPGYTWKNYHVKDHLTSTHQIFMNSLHFSAPLAVTLSSYNQFWIIKWKCNDTNLFWPRHFRVSELYLPLSLTAVETSETPYSTWHRVEGLSSL